jgi:hypothetical protein
MLGKRTSLRKSGVIEGGTQMHTTAKEPKPAKPKAPASPVKDLRPVKDAKAGGQKKEGPILDPIKLT